MNRVILTMYARTMVKRPDSRGRFGSYGGRFVPETLMPALERAADIMSDPEARNVCENSLSQLEIEDKEMWHCLPSLQTSLQSTKI